MDILKLPIDQILLGDTIEQMNALPERSVDLVFADPPYNLQLGGELWRPNNTHVDPADDHWDQFDSFAAYDEFTRSWLTAARRVMKETATLWVIGSYHNIYRVGAILFDLGFWVLNDVVWIKDNPMPNMNGTRLCNAHETLLWVKKARNSVGYTFNYKAMKAMNGGKQLRSDWRFPICSGSERLMSNGVKAHSTQKPEALLEQVLLASTTPGQVVLDPFCGSGTTAAVAKRLDRRYITIDREPEYVELARKRLADTIPALPETYTYEFEPLKPRIPFKTLVERGDIAVGSTLVHGKGKFTATVNDDGTITVGDLTGTIHAVGAKCAGAPKCNGWMFWQYRDPRTGILRPLDDLRPTARELEDRKGAAAIRQKT